MVATDSSDEMARSEARLPLMISVPVPSFVATPAARAAQSAHAPPRSSISDHGPLYRFLMLPLIVPLVRANRSAREESADHESPRPSARPRRDRRTGTTATIHRS